MFLDVIVIHSPTTCFKFQLSHWACLSTVTTLSSSSPNIL